MQKALERINRQVDNHGKLVVAQAQLEGREAMKQIRRNANFPARSAGQIKRWKGR